MNAISPVDVLSLRPETMNEKSMEGVFQKKIGIQNEALFHMIWRQSIDSHRIQFHPKNADLVQKIDAAIRDTLVFHGKGIDFASDAGTISQMVRYLLGKGVFSAEWMKEVNMSGIVLKKDLVQLQGMRDAFREVLHDTAEHLPEKGSKQEIVFQSFVGNIIALIPFSYPEEGEEWVIPQKINGDWKRIVYHVDRKIELTNERFSSPIVAYGLTAEDGPPLLTFLGTTYPAGDGFIATLLADFTPGCSVGHLPFMQGKQKIANWLEGKSGVRLYGASLGGALTFHTVRTFPDKIDQVDAYNPPGLYPWDWKKGQELPPINIYYQNNDLVGTMGFFPEGKNVSVYRVMGEKRENFLKAHTRAYTGGEEVTILKSSPTFENSRLSRKVLTILHIIFGIFLFFLPILLAYGLYCLLIKPFLSL